MLISKHRLENLKRGDKLTHRLGMDVIFISKYPLASGTIQLQCRYINKKGEFVIEEFYPDEFE